MNLSGASTGLLYDCVTHDSQCFRSEQKVPARANWLPARPIELSLGLARLTELAIRARQSCELHRPPFEREIGFFVAGENIAHYSPFDRGPILYIWYKGKAVFNERLK